MGLNRSTRATNIKNRIAALGVAAGTPVTGPQIIQVWTIVCDEIDLELESANCKIAAGTFEVTVGGPGTYPVTGDGGPVEP